MVSFTCSVLEAVILSLTPSYAASLETRKPKLYEKIKFLKDDIERPLASILTFNTIAHTIGAAGAGAEAQKLWGNEYLTIFSAVLTFAILFFSEIIPKSIGAKFWKSLLPFSMRIITPMIILSYPVVWLSEKITNLIKGNGIDKISREEISALAELGFSSGSIHKNEYQTMKSLMKFTNINMKDILKPADTVVGLNYNESIAESMVDINSHTFSRLIVFGVNRDDLKGYVMRKDILDSYIKKKEIQVKDIMMKIDILPHTVQSHILLERLLKRKAHICAIVDDGGAFLGIITLEDLIESLLGLSIYDEFDRP